jgi:metal-responsive CopG/Arc/MetJ family transcriptional regulator
MATAKIAISIDKELLQRLDEAVKAKLFTNRSRAIQVALQTELKHLGRTRLEQALDHVDPEAEKAMAEEGMSFELEQWPPY